MRTGEEGDEGAGVAMASQQTERGEEGALPRIASEGSKGVLTSMGKGM
jgi:hypothetical protein